MKLKGSSSSKEKKAEEKSKSGSKTSNFGSLKLNKSKDEAGRVIMPTTPTTPTKFISTTTQDTSESNSSSKKKFDPIHRELNEKFKLNCIGGGGTVTTPVKKQAYGNSDLANANELKQSCSKLEADCKSKQNRIHFY